MTVHAFPSAMTEASARAVLANPHVRQTQQLRRIAWAVLKTARGQTVRQTTLNRLARTMQAGGGKE